MHPFTRFIMRTNTDIPKPKKKKRRCKSTMSGRSSEKKVKWKFRIETSCPFKKEDPSVFVRFASNNQRTLLNEPLKGILKIKNSPIKIENRSVSIEEKETEASTSINDEFDSPRMLRVRRVPETLSPKFEHFKSSSYIPSYPTYSSYQSNYYTARSSYEPRIGRIRHYGRRPIRAYY